MTALLTALAMTISNYTPIPPGPMELAVAEIIAGETMAVADTGAVRTGNSVQETPTLPPPPPVPTGLWGLPFAPEGLSNCDEMNFYRQQFGLPGAFSAIGWRESNCRNEDGVHTFCCHGYWQLHKIHFNGSGRVYGVDCQAFSVFDVASDTPFDKQRQACAAKALYDEVGLGAWSTS